MLVTRIKLSNFRRLALASIQDIEIDFTELLTCILGPNSCGKSSLIGEVSPLPIIASMYRTGGYKEIDITHNGSKYEIISINRSSVKNTLIKDGVVIHQDVTSTMHKEVVEREFGFTPLIQKVVTGQVKFTRMLPNQRRELLTSISTLKLDYLLDLHERVKREHRDSQGAINHIKRKMESLNDRLNVLEKEDVGQLMTEIDSIQHQIRTLIPFTSNTNLQAKPHHDALMQACRNLDQIIYEFTHPRRGIPEHSFNSFEALKDALVSQQHQRVSCETTIQHLLDEQAELNKLIEVVQNTDDGIDKLQAKEAYLRQQIETLRHEPGVDYGHTPIATIESDLRSLAVQLYELHVTRNDDMLPCTREEYTQTTEQYQLAQTELASATQAYEATLRRFQAAETAREHDVTCPECTFIIRGEESVDDEQFEQLKQRLNQRELTLLTTRKTCEAITERVQRMGLYIKHLKAVHGLIRQHSTLAPFWDVLGETPSIVDNLALAVDTLNKEIRRVQENETLAQHQKSLQEVEDVIRITQLAEGQKASERIRAIDGKLDQQYVVLDQCRQEEKHLEGCVKYYQGLQETYSRAEQALQNIAQHFEAWVEAETHEQVNAEIGKLQGGLSMRQGVVDNKQHLDAEMADLTKDLSELDMERKALAILQAELSPTSGEISDQMRGYLEDFLKQVNTVLRHLWNFPMEVGLCKADESDQTGLDYKFPILGGDEPTTDIGLGSSGQKDIIDFTFTLALMSYMGLQDYPLFMDEIGVYSDQDHRMNLINFVRMMLDEQRCTQLFMINHYQSNYSGFANSNVVVLSPDNIVVPDNYNQSVRIGYE